MPNHDHNDDPPPPPMSEATLDAAALDALLRDIGALVSLDEIIVKDGPGRVDDARVIGFEDAARMLRERSVRAVQFRYRHEGARWWDTLMTTPGGHRLVRVRHDF